MIPEAPSLRLFLRNDPNPLMQQEQILMHQIISSPILCRRYLRAVDIPLNDKTICPPSSHGFYYVKAFQKNKITIFKKGVQNAEPRGAIKRVFWKDS